MKRIDYRLLSFEFIRYFLICIFLYTTYHKIIDMERFEEDLFRSKLLSNFAIYIKYLIPMSEICVIMLLFIDKYIVIGLYLSLFLLSIFTIYLFFLDHLSLFYGCSCGGVFNTMNYSEHIFINICLILSNILGIFLYQKKYYNEVNIY